MVPRDPKLRSPYRLLTLTDGAESERVLDAIHQRRRELEREHVLGAEPATQLRRRSLAV
jgi:hypothetical protein